MVVLCVEESEYLDAAERIAEDRNENVVTSLDAVGADEPVVYVAGPEELDESTLLSLQRRLSADGPSAGRFSVVTGYTPSFAVDLYHREQRDVEIDCLLLKDPPDGYEPGAEDTVLHRNDDGIAERLSALEDDGLSSLSMHVGGFPLHIFLNGGILCGFPTRVDPDSYEGPQPQCVRDGERDCPLDDGELLPVDEFSVDHVFMGSCASMIGNGPSGLPVHVGTGLLAEATSLIGGYRISPIDPTEPLLHHSLVKAGYDVVERCYLLNEYSHLNDIQAYPYVPFGSPDAGGDPEPRSPSVRSVDEATRIEVTVDGYVGDFRVPLSDLPETDDRYYLRSTSPHGDGGDRYYLAFREGETLRVLVFAGRRLDGERLELVVDDSMADERRLRTMYDCLDAVERNLRLGMFDGERGEIARKFRSELLDSHHVVTRERLNLDAHRRSVAAVDEVYERVEELTRGLLEPLDDGSLLVGRYARRAIDGDTMATDQECVHCGRPLFLKEVSDLPGTVHRALGECPQCAQVFDVPTTPGETDPLRPVVEGELFETNAPRREFTVEFENDRDVTREVTIYPTIWEYGDTTRDGTRIFTPRSADRTLEPGETARVTFEVDAGSLENNQYYVVTHVVANLEVYSEMGTTMVVGEKTGYMPPYRR